MKILVAEDNATFRLILGGLLKKLGHQVTAVESGLQAWNAFQKEYFPILITDWQMPEMDGTVLTTLVRTKPYDRYSYLIMLTAKGGKESYLAAMKAGVDDFIVKPPDEEQLSARMLVAERIVGVHNHVKQLEAIMSVCSYCKNVREGDRWVAMEQYIALHTGTLSSHGICPNCFETRVRPELEQLGIESLSAR
jgi:sigma-B regulation protein RsbU (phosphoserine phosphatase)